jgi:hypothetical protein
LCNPVENIVQSSRPQIKFGQIDDVELVGVEPIRSEEHREEEKDIRIGEERLPEAQNFRLPSRVTLQNDTGAIRAYNVFGVYQHPSQASAGKREYQEADVGSIRNVGITCRVDILSEWELGGLSVSDGTKQLS